MTSPGARAGDRPRSATRQGWSERSETGDSLMKFSESSSGCEPRPAKGEPAQPVASLATVTATWPAMRRCASEWAVGKAATKTTSSRVPRAFFCPKAMAACPQKGEGRLYPAGCTTTARSKRTVQAPGRPTFLLGQYRSDGDPVITPRRAARLRMRARPADATVVAPHRRSIRARVGGRQGRPELTPTGTRESEGCIRAKTSGNGVASGPGRAKAARAGVSFRRELCPMHRRRGACHRDF
jgi:hypothetical protein